MGLKFESYEELPDAKSIDIKDLAPKQFFVPVDDGPSKLHFITKKKEIINLETGEHVDSSKFNKVYICEIYAKMWAINW